MITYRPRSALREMAKVVGLSPGHADVLTKWIDRWSRDSTSFEGLQGEGPPVPKLALDLAEQVIDFPRHLGIHSGGMVMADRPLIECCPVEWARMEDRSVLQWDKEDCAAAGLVKFDLLGLGMLTMLHLAVDLVREHEGVEVELATIPQEPEVYTLLSAADTIGVFQVESRAQMATLPRLRPECFYDLVVEVALIRPGPIQGGSVHPYLRRRNGQEEVTYPHPLLEKCLEKTLGVPLFQEQLMQMAIDVAGFTPGESDRLRQAMGSKRSRARMAAMRDRLLTGMAARGITGEVADDIVHKIEGFADFGFPESHSVSFAYLVYSSSWIKLHYPAEFACALLNAQPMGFYSPHTIVRDATRHGVEVLGPCVRASRRDCTLEPRTEAAGPIGRPRPGWHADPSIHAMRVGLRYVRGLSDALLDRIDDARDDEPFTDLADFTRRTGAPTDALEALATAGAFALLRPQPTRRVVGSGRVARRPPRQAAGHGHRRRRAHAPGHDRRRGDRRRPLGDRALGRPSPHRVRARRADGARHRHRRGAARAPGPHRRRHRGRGHPPAAAVDLEGRHLPQPGGRDRPDQRDLHARRVEALPQGGAHRAGAGDPGPARALPGGDQRARPPDRRAAPRPHRPVALHATSTERAGDAVRGDATPRGEHRSTTTEGTWARQCRRGHGVAGPTPPRSS